MKSKALEYGGKLALVSVIAMFGVAGAWVLARSRIEAGKQAAFDSAIREVLGESADGPAPKALNPDAAREERVFFAEVDGEKRYATQGVHQGFSSKVVVAVGATLDGDDLRIREVRVISQNETPGLGTRIAEQETNLTLWSTIGKWLGAKTKEKTEYSFLRRFREKELRNLEVTGDPAQENEKILRITGATISTTACVAAASQAMQRIRKTIPVGK